jgi:hypothetical protein
MPTISLVVCVSNQRNLLKRLLQEAHGCHDELVVVHDGPDTTNVRTVVEEANGRFYERPLGNQQEPHWPFAWGQAVHDWILRLDADEFPSEEMKEWLQRFRQGPDPPESVSGYTCIWPIWNGIRAVTKHWPAGRIFLMNRQRVRFFGIAEQTPIPDGRFVALPLILNHRPPRRSHGLRNVLFRRQAYTWRNVIARGLLGKPTDLPCWRWDNPAWPERWEEVRRRPLRTAIARLVMDTLRTLRDQWKNERKILLSTAINGPINHMLFCFVYCQVRRLQKRKRLEEQVPKKSQ